jgi:integrase
VRIKPLLGARKLRKLSAADLDAFYAHQRRKGGRSGKPLGAATVRRTHVVVHAALAQAVRWRWLAVNPAATASPPRVVPNEITPPEPEDVMKLLKLLKDEDPALHSYVRLAATSGARRSQLVGLRWSDIDFEARTATFARAVVLGPTSVEVRTTTKGNRTYRISLDPGTLAVLQDHRRRAADVAAGCEAELVEDAYVFSSQVDGSKPWRPDALTRRFRRVSDRAGLPGVRLHDLRHYVATRLLAAGADVRTVAGRLGHANPAVTLSVYSHFVPDQAAAEALADLLDD